MLTSGQLRVFPNRASTLHCGDPIKRSKAVCLFGVPDPVETEKLFKEQMMLNRTNFLRKWNIDIFSELPSSRSVVLRLETQTTQHIDDAEHRTCVENLEANDGDNCINNSSLEEVVENCRNEEVQLKKPRKGTSSCNGVRTGRVERCGPSQRSKQMKITDFWPKKKYSHL